MNPTDLHDIQKLIVRGFNTHYSRFFVLSIDNAAMARKFLTTLGADNLISTAEKKSAVQDPHEDKKITCHVSIGLTYPGLVKLGLHPRYQDVFRNKAKAFYEGAFPRAATHLADTHLNASHLWNSAFAPSTADVLLALHSDRLDILDEHETRLQQLAGVPAADATPAAFTRVSWGHRFDGAHLEQTEDARRSRRAHFDMLDGISLPNIKDYTKPRSPATSLPPHEMGEFILGHDNDAGYNPWRLSNERPDLSDIPASMQSAEIAKFFKNASFGIFRPMEQDESAFNALIEKNAGQLGETPDYVRAKLLGRWENGSVLKPGARASPAKVAPDLNDFDFSKDSKAEGCPFGAHIRRMNPRSDPVVPFRRRPLMRRGIPYGPKLIKHDSQSTQLERGLLGLFFCASIEDQFEHLIKEWANDKPMGVPNKGDAKDPLIGNHVQQDTQFDVPMSVEMQRTIEGFTPFVKTKGTLYAFFPGLNGLRLFSDPKVFKP